jgi:carbonic anhydrase
MCTSHDPIDRLVKGYKDFYADYHKPEYRDYVEQASLGQSPRVMMIACSDSRVNPTIVTGARLGDIFTVCNVANIVPHFEPSWHTHHSTSAALEFAVNSLSVEHVIVMGHSGCGGIRALLGDTPIARDASHSFIKPWVEIITAARDRVMHLPQEERQHACELEALKISLSNLRTFPWVEEKIAQGILHIHAWHFDIPSGVIRTFQPAHNRFEPLLGDMEAGLCRLA